MRMAPLCFYLSLQPHEPLSLRESWSCNPQKLVLFFFISFLLARNYTATVPSCSKPESVMRLKLLPEMIFFPFYFYLLSSADEIPQILPKRLQPYY